MSQVEEPETTCDKAPIVMEKFDVEESVAQKKAHESHANKNVIFVLLILVVGLLILAVIGLTIAFTQEIAKLKHKISLLEWEQNSTEAERMSNYFQQLNSSFNQKFSDEIDSVKSKILNETIASIVQLNETIAALDDRSKLVFEAISSEQQESLIAVEDRLDSLNASVDENYLLTNQLVTSHHQDFMLRLETLSVRLQIVNASLDDSYRQHEETVTSIQQNVTLMFESVAEKLEGLIFSGSVNCQLLNESLIALEENYEVKFENISSEQEKAFNSSILSLKFLVNELLQQHNFSFNQLLSSKIESVKSAVFRQLNDSQKLNASINEIDSRFNQTITALEENSDLKFGIFSEKYEQLNSKIREIDGNFRMKFENISAELEQTFTMFAYDVINLNSSVDIAFQQLHSSDQLLSNAIENIQSDQESDAQALNASLLSKHSQLNQITSMLAEKLGRLSAKQEQIFTALVDQITNLNSSLDEVYLELSETIDELDYSFENSSANQEQMINSVANTLTNLELTVDDLLLKIIDTEKTAQELNASFTNLLGNQVEELHTILQEQHNDSQKLNTSINQKYFKLNQTIVALNESSNQNFQNVSEEQNQNVNTISGRIENLNSSVIMLFQKLANDNRLEQLNASFTQLLNQQIQDILLRQLNESQRLNTTFNRTYSNINQTLSDLQTSLATIGQWPFYPASSCAALSPSSPSGYYLVQDSSGSAVHVYCDMTRSCGGVAGGWVRVAHLNMTDSSQQCPSGLRQRTDSNRRTCVRHTDPAGCSSVQYTTANIQYSRVCGKIRGYQVGRPNAFYQGGQTISSTYLDGVSLTHGTPKQHIWSFAATPAERQARFTSSCLCMNPDAPSPPSFIASSNYFCDTGLLNLNDVPNPGFLGDDPLWDGQGCGPTNNCCTFNTPPWFHKQLPQSTTDDIEMRVCRNEDASNEDIAIELIEIYVQ